MRVKLEHPIKKTGMILGIGETVIEEITLRAPTVKDIMGLDFNPPHSNTAFALLISRLSGLQMVQVEQIHLVDFQTISEAVNKLAGWGRK
jgi:hypothetical protein